MATSQIRFDDGASYERIMGIWSQFAGHVFLDWLAPKTGLHWIDVGCGNGAFTELIVQRCAPSLVEGIDPSEGQLAFARSRPAGRMATFRQGDAMALPCPDAHFDVAVMALVIFFVPDPKKGVAELKRVLRSGGIAGAYAWDIYGGGLPWEIVQNEIRALGHNTLRPPSADASRLDRLQELWTNAGFVRVETRQIAVERTFESVDEFFSIALNTPTVGPVVRAMPTADVELLKARLRKKLPLEETGRVTLTARANAVKGSAD